MKGGQTVYAVVGGSVLEGRITHVKPEYKGKCERYVEYMLDGKTWVPQWDVHTTRKAAKEHQNTIR